MKSPDYHLWGDPMERFLSKIEVSESGCWEWLARINRYGYGQFWLRSTPFSAHRFSYLVFKGEFTENKVLDHLCRNRKCVNPEHLEEVTHKVNVERGDNLAVRLRNKTHCKWGHLLEGDSIDTRQGFRRCLICAQRIQREWYHKNKLEIAEKSMYEIL